MSCLYSDDEGEAKDKVILQVRRVSIANSVINLEIEARHYGSEENVVSVLR